MELIGVVPLAPSLSHGAAAVPVHYEGVPISVPVLNKAPCSGLNEGQENFKGALGRYLKLKGLKEQTAAGALEEELPSDVVVVARGVC